MYYLSKYYEMLDTLFVLLQKSRVPHFKLQAPRPTPSTTEVLEADVVPPCPLVPFHPPISLIWPFDSAFDSRGGALSASRLYYYYYYYYY